MSAKRALTDYIILLSFNIIFMLFMKNKDLRNVFFLNLT